MLYIYKASDICRKPLKSLGDNSSYSSKRFILFQSLPCFFSMSVLLWVQQSLHKFCICSFAIKPNSFGHFEGGNPHGLLGSCADQPQESIMGKATALTFSHQMQLVNGKLMGLAGMIGGSSHLVSGR